MADGSSAVSQSTSVRLRFGDFDPNGHVNNVAYFAVMESGRVDFLTAMRDRGRLPSTMLCHAEIDYRRPIQLGTWEVLVTTSVDDIGRSSFRVRQVIEDADGPAAEGACVLVAQNRHGVTRPLTDPERRNLLGQPEEETSNSIRCTRTTS